MRRRRRRPRNGNRSRKWRAVHDERAAFSVRLEYNWPEIKSREGAEWYDVLDDFSGLMLPRSRAFKCGLRWSQSSFLSSGSIHVYSYGRTITDSEHRRIRDFFTRHPFVSECRVSDVHLPPTAKQQELAHRQWTARMLRMIKALDTEFTD